MPALERNQQRHRRFTDPEIQEIAYSSRERIAEWVRSTAAERSIEYVSTPGDRFAHEASRLSDAGAELDSTGYLLLALRRAGVISSHQRLRLYGSYLR